MRFTKMHGIGNDYIYVNCFEETVASPSPLAARLSDRRFGIGGDGLILIQPSSRADCKMDMYNADGSQGRMCGNGIRCVAKYAYERGIAQKEVMTIETLSGVKTLFLTVRNGVVEAVRVNMGPPELVPEKIPVRLAGGRAVDCPVKLAGGETVALTCVSMGNPHAVAFCEDVNAFPLETLGPKVESDPLFPEKVNFEIVRVMGPREIEMRVWERGSGETWACGTGACACAVACVLNGKTARQVKVHLRGGDLEIAWDETTGDVFMTGPATFVFDGEVEI